MIEESVSELQDIFIKPPKLKSREEKKTDRISKNVGQL